MQATCSTTSTTPAAQITSTAETTTANNSTDAEAGASTISVTEPRSVLKRQVGLVTATSLVIGSMIGTGIFISPGGVVLKAGSPATGLIVWAATGVFSLVGALCYAEVGCAIPLSGGEYIYLLKTFEGLGRAGSVPAFLFMWTNALLLVPASSAVICLTFADYFLRLFVGRPPGALRQSWAVFATVSLTTVNCISVRATGWVQNMFSLLKLLILALLAVGGVVAFIQGTNFNLGFSEHSGETSTARITEAFYYGLWAYSGWNNLSIITEELVNPEKNIYRALVLGISIVTAAYLLTNVAYLAVLGPEEMATSSLVALTFAKKALFPQLAAAMPLLVALSAYGAELCGSFSAGRMYFAAAREGHLPEILSYISVDYLTPTPALLLKGLLTVIMIVSGDVSQLITVLGFTQGLVTAAMMASLVILRYTKKDAPRPFRVYLIFPLAVGLCFLYTVVVSLMNSPQYLYATIFIVSGLVFLWLRPPASYSDRVTNFLKEILDVVPTEYPSLSK